MRKNLLKHRPRSIAIREGGIPVDHVHPPAWQAILIVIVLITLTSTAYWQVKDNGFIDYDDPEYVTSNSYIDNGLTLEAVRWAFFDFHASNWHPVTWISHMIDVQIYGMRPEGHHLTNLVLHVLSTLLLLVFLLYSTGRLWVSGFVAAAFAVHPLHVESVAWVAERKDVLSTFFCFAAMLAYARYARKPDWARYASVVGLLVLALMSKPMAVTLPVILLLLDYWPLERFGAGLKGFWRLLVEKIPLAVIAGCSIVITLAAQSGAIAPGEMTNLASRVSNATISYARYIVMMFWPANLAVFYPHPHKAIWALAGVSFLILLAATVAAIYYGRKRKYLVTGWLWYMITLLPVIGLIQVGDQSHANRYTYIPLVGLFIIIAFGLAEIVHDIPRLKWACITAGMAIVVLMGIRTDREVSYWKDSTTLFSRALDVTEDNQTMMTSLGVCLMNKGELDKSQVLLEKAVSIRPAVIAPRYNLGMVYVKKGQFQAAAQEFEKITSVSNYENAWVNLGNCMLAMQRPQDAEMVYREGIKRMPGVAELHFDLGVLLAETGRKSEGIEEMQKAISLPVDRQKTRDYMMQLLRKTQSEN